MNAYLHSDILREISRLKLLRSSVIVAYIFHPLCHFGFKNYFGVMHWMVTYAYFCHQALVDDMRRVYADFPVCLQGHVRDLLTDQLYLSLSNAATQVGNVHIVLEKYLSLLKGKGDGNDRRNYISQMLTKNGVQTVQAPLKHLFGHTVWQGRTLEAPIMEADVPPERLRGKASTLIIRAQDFLDFIVRARMVPERLLPGLYGVEVMARNQVKELVATQERLPDDPEEMIRYRCNMEPPSPNWHMYVHPHKGVFATMNVGRRAGPREREYDEAGFIKCENGRIVVNTSQVFEALRNALRRGKAWRQKIMVCGKNNRTVFYLNNPKKTVWQHIDKALFDATCQRWLTRVWRVISECTGVETSEKAPRPKQKKAKTSPPHSSPKASTSKDHKNADKTPTPDSTEEGPMDDECQEQDPVDDARHLPTRSPTVKRPTTGGKCPRQAHFPIGPSTSQADIRRVFPSCLPPESVWTTDDDTLPSSPEAAPAPVHHGKRMVTQKTPRKATPPVKSGWVISPKKTQAKKRKVARLMAKAAREANHTASMYNMTGPKVQHRAKAHSSK